MNADVVNELLRQREEINQRVRALLEQWDARMGAIQDELFEYASSNACEIKAGRMPGSPLGDGAFADIVDGIQVHLAERDEDAETLPTVAVLVYDPRTKVRVEFNTPPAADALLALIAGLRDAAARAIEPKGDR
ncbi:hypothetical protein ACIHFD_61645 [Nonomuraea sp. NPDC051941]|uniref:hypothetical protein n=1 Tax=Nonomuraea sp. NPDC051941 TaxID=3364373 RepID=UPI0037C577EA